MRLAQKQETSDAAARRARYARERIEFWNGFAAELERSWPLRRHYRAQIARLFAFSVAPGQSILEVGSGTGDLLAALRPACGVGVDFSPAMVELARRRHPHLRFVQSDAHSFDLGEKFDIIVCSDLINDLWDVQAAFDRIAAHSHSSTRVLVNFYSRLWEGPRKVAEFLGLAKPQLPQNWLTREDVANLLRLTGFEPLRCSPEIMCPVPALLLEALANRFLVRLWPFRHLGITNFLTARPQPPPGPARESTVSVIVPARNEEGNIPQLFDRLPLIGAGTELIIVEGGSKDRTLQAVEREIALHPCCPARLIRQSGKGKGDAVRLGFSHARGELLIILDADLTVMPEDLPRFYEAWRNGCGDFINGVRLVYPADDRAMRFFNFLANKFFSLAFSWLLGQSVKDTLCGTKALSRRDYELIAANRSWLGELDPFGDFDLLFGAARFNLKIVDIPIRYVERTYGETNIRRWRHGLLLLRMVLLALRRFKFF